ncbi:TRAP transporter small permease [Vibrio scophthalmi]|uniref:TRAP transporter small permease protein n=1 Tax=Vibrio scophthalmi LMG 19158 TaxID=870967 RepID=F9RV59_9VIBR|nr:TRAP transporter small permease [Vibrio scophthalmi]EGU29783.1 trap-type c4-dicarboxylate transport system, small permease component [Vibrio scophthalmi LMG 19158]MCY9802599.1 TRAP transporter small permease [Vibrio scophthalmi]
MSKLSKVFCEEFEEYLSVALFLALIVLCLLQILFRFVFNFSLSWTEELARYVFIALVYAASSLAVIKGAHVRVEIIDNFVSGKAKYYLDQVIEASWCAFMIYIGIYGVEITVEALRVSQVTPALGWQIGWIYMIVPVFFFLISLRLVQRMYHRFQNRDALIASSNDSEVQ